MPDHALELSFDTDSHAAVEAQWQALADAGLPSQAEHRSMTNAPHLTLVAASPISHGVLAPARDLVLPLLPATLAVRGLVVLGEGPRVTLAHLVEPDEALAEATARLRALVPWVRHAVWTPHVTLARRLPRHRLAEALAALDANRIRRLTATRLRWWDPDLGTIEEWTPETYRPR